MNILITPIPITPKLHPTRMISDRDTFNQIHNLSGYTDPYVGKKDSSHKSGMILVMMALEIPVEEAPLLVDIFMNEILDPEQQDKHGFESKEIYPNKSIIIEYQWLMM